MPRTATQQSAITGGLCIISLGLTAAIIYSVIMLVDTFKDQGLLFLITVVPIIAVVSIMIIFYIIENMKEYLNITSSNKTAASPLDQEAVRFIEPEATE